MVFLTAFSHLISGITPFFYSKVTGPEAQQEEMENVYGEIANRVSYWKGFQFLWEWWCQFSKLDTDFWEKPLHFPMYTS